MKLSNECASDELPKVSDGARREREAREGIPGRDDRDQLGSGRGG